MSFELKIKEIITDNYSGSAALLDKLIKSIQTYINYQEIDRDYLQDSLNSITEHFPHLSVINHFLQQFYNLLEDIQPEIGHNEQAGARIESFLSGYISEWKDNMGQAAERMTRLIKFQHKKILLHSNSSSIHVLFEHLAMHNIFPTIYQTMSAPAFEGKIQANALSELGCKIRLIKEVAVKRFIHETDFAITGAETIFNNGYTNKKGSLLIAHACHETSRPLYVICDSRKRSPIDFIARSGYGSGQEVPPIAPFDKVTESNATEYAPPDFIDNKNVHTYFFEDTWWDMHKKA